jgi:glutathione synthase/RimK-type ligase-like ATP-grasp enzyme
MKSNFRLYPYKMGSKSSRDLCESLGGIQVYPDRKFRPKPRHILINWGNTLKPNWWVNGLEILNKFEAVANAKDKFKALTLLRENGVHCVDFTTNTSESHVWLEHGHKVYCRTTTTGHSGEGIVIAQDETELVKAKLYTKGIEIKGEYRVHVFDGEVIDYVKKRRRFDDEPTEEQNEVRSHDNGWIFTRENLRRLERIEELAINAVKALGLDFGAVDIVKDFDNNCFVLEVNTACGIEGTTLENYKQAIIKHFNN